MKWLKKARGMGAGTWLREKQKAAAFIKLSEGLGGKMIVSQVMKRNWYRHIDKALAGNTTARDFKHWKKMVKMFKRELVGTPTRETSSLLEWLEGFKERVKVEKITKSDLAKWLPHFKEYMLSCEGNYANNYIIKNELMEG